MVHQWKGKEGALPKETLRSCPRRRWRAPQACNHESSEKRERELKRMVWSRVLKTAERSRMKRSLVTLEQVHIKEVALCLAQIVRGHNVTEGTETGTDVFQLSRKKQYSPPVLK